MATEIIKRQIYNIECIEYKDGTTTMSRTCDNFNALELLGVLSLTQAEIIEQIRGKYKPDIINRTVIINQKQKTK